MVLACVYLSDHEQRKKSVTTSSARAEPFDGAQDKLRPQGEVEACTAFFIILLVDWRWGSSFAAVGDPFYNVLRQRISGLVIQGALRTRFCLIEVSLVKGFAGAEGIHMGANGADFTWQGTRAGILLH